jgi:hypothetical protein
MIMRLLLAGLTRGSAWRANAQQTAIGFGGAGASIDSHVRNA